MLGAPEASSSPAPKVGAAAKSDEAGRKKPKKKTREGNSRPDQAKSTELKTGERDAVTIPRIGHPSLQTARRPPNGPKLQGWSGAMQRPAFPDRRRRREEVPLPNDFGHTMKVGERFAFDVTFGGNPAGQVEAKVAAIESDHRGADPDGADLVRIEGKVLSTGVVSMLSTVRADVATWIDRRTGVSVHNEMLIRRSGLGAAYKKRVTKTEYEGRGRVRITDDVDGKVRKFVRTLPADTLDDLAVMAWVRSLDLAEGERARSHVLDGRVLMRMEVVGRGKASLDPMPGIVTALGVTPDQIRLLEGTLTRVDNFDVPLPGKRVYNFRAWLSADDRRLVLRLESDMWLGVIRLGLAAYDPPLQP
jgi:hypothetical protein